MTETAETDQPLEPVLPSPESDEVAPNAPDAKKSLLLIQHSQQSIHSGPVPSPEQLAQYNEIDPTFANRLLTMAENVQRANNEMKLAEAYRIRKESDAIYRGQFFVVFLIVLLVGAGTWLGSMSQASPHVATVAVAAFGVCGALFYLMWRTNRPAKKGD